MSRDPGLYLDALLRGTARVLEATRHLDFETFSEEWMVRDAVIRNLEVIGESARRLPAALKAKHPQVPWAHLARLREILVHSYFQVDDVILWSLIQEHLPDLQAAVEALLREAPPAPASPHG